ncbi:MULTISPECIES: sugar phosphate isomerase/epimerase [Microbacterium]|uniref:sugar phosphate isomerase/epimerase family protein n=1 Tax=Microbacterium TaxID=33882 RepID=UPI0027858641|nr:MULTISPECIES: TIM barrel protein [Microbacterium]MDQ1082710.1 sugar phosphate isomerase/epimerase [Microbacterium sp. SORGH_AS_0344]MDQ1168519.1 sugar phosphate isomerase/epimerase [Microbacterium proteolyticum]
MQTTPLSWQLASCVLGLSATDPHGRPATSADAGFWFEQLGDVAAEGFGAVEISDAWIRVADLTASRRSELVSVTRSVGLDIPALHVQRASVIAPDRGEQNLAYHHASLDAAAELGVSVYSTGLHHPFSPQQERALWFWTAPGPRDPDDDDMRALAVRRIRELGVHAAELGLELSLELYEDTYLGTGAGAVRFVEEVGLTNVGLNPDVGNLIRLHRPVESWLELYETTLPYANYWHAKNYLRDETPDGEHIATAPSTLRDGVINYRVVLDIARRVGYRGVITCEHYGGDSLSVCGANRRYLTHLMSRRSVASPSRTGITDAAASIERTPSL